MVYETLVFFQALLDFEEIIISVIMVLLSNCIRMRKKIMLIIVFILQNDFRCLYKDVN